MPSAISQKNARRRRFWSFYLVFNIIALAVLGSLAYTQFLNPNYHSLRVDGQLRRYLLYVPDSYNPNQATSLVLSLHGFASWPVNQAFVSQWDALADQHGFIVAYPQGTQVPLRWRTAGLDAGENSSGPDIAFLSKLIDELSQTYAIDPNRIYANGLSNGAGMSFVLSCQLSEKVAAVGLVAGAYNYPWQDCQPERQVPAIIFHGDADPIVPFTGGQSGPNQIFLPDVTQWVHTLAEKNGCSPLPGTSDLTPHVAQTRFTDCQADTVFYRISGGGHSWPGGGELPERIVGITTHEVNASALMWDFFQQHPLD